jgi:GNAT superfamily N-acetyltransferase
MALMPDDRFRTGRPFWAVERGSLWVADLGGDGLKAQPSRASVDAVFSEAHREETERVAQAMGLVNQAPVLRRLASGRRCFIARVNGEIAAYGWVSRSVECIGEIEHELHLLPEEAYVWDCATLPQYRRKGLYTALLSFILANLCHEDLNRVWIGSSLKNKPSLRGFSKAGFQPVIRLFYLRLFSLSFLRVSREPASSPALSTAAQQILTAAWKFRWRSFGLDIITQQPLRPAVQSSCSDGTV